MSRLEIPEYTDLIGLTYEDLNCWELAIEIYSRVSIDLKDFDVSAQAVRLVAKTMKKEQVSSSWKDVLEPENLCIIPIRVVGGFVSHCGVYVGNGKFIHSLADQGVITTRLGDPAWKNKIMGFCRYVGN